MAEDGSKKAGAAEQNKRQHLLSAPSSHLTLLAAGTVSPSVPTVPLWDSEKSSVWEIISSTQLINVPYKSYMFSLDLNTFLFFSESSTSDHEINLRMSIWAMWVKKLPPIHPQISNHSFSRARQNLLGSNNHPTREPPIISMTVCSFIFHLGTSLIEKGIAGNLSFKSVKSSWRNTA